MSRLFPPQLFLISIVAALLAHVLVPGPTLLVWPRVLVGVVPLLAGLALCVWGSRTFSRAETPISPIAQPEVLVSEGPFRISRNPMYLGLVVALTGVWLLLGSAAPGLVVAGYALILDRRFIAVEERNMAAAFGQRFADYRQRTRRWL